jgi:hypothetical protein
VYKQKENERVTLSKNTRAEKNEWVLRDIVPVYLLSKRK